MVNKIMRFTDLVAANEPAAKIGELSPANDRTVELEELWTDGTTDIELTMNVEERSLIDGVPLPQLGTVSERIVFKHTLNGGESLTFVANEQSGADQNPEVYLLVNET